MSSSDEIFVGLRQKLDILGFTQILPFSGVPLVGALLEDIVKTTESLRDAKKKIVDLLEEKSCWELGVEPYKCDNTRLLTECNELRLQQMKEREDYEQRICDLNEKVRNLNMEKQHLEEHCLKLQQQLKSLIKQSSSTSATIRNTKENNMKSKKPFITTVRSNEKIISNKSQVADIGYLKCTKCSAGYYQTPFTLGEKITATTTSVEQDKLENRIKDLMEQLSFYKRKMEARDREIQRLNNLLLGGRPPAALAKDCCYKNVGALTQDVELLQRDKSDCLNKIREYQEQMHEAMQKALSLETLNKQLQQELEELKEAALRVEAQANSEIDEQERELEQLRTELTNLREKYERVSYNDCSIPEEKHDNSTKLNKRYLNERLNELTQKEIGLNAKNERLQKKVLKLKNKISTIQKDLQETNGKNENNLDEEKIRLKSERDFFQKEYLRLVSKSGSDNEIEFLQSQIKMKDEELRVLRSELCIRTVGLESELKPVCNDISNAFDSVPNSARSTNSHVSGKNSDCIQAVLLRAERERDLLKKDLERLRCERDMLREKHVCMTQCRVEESKQRQQYTDELNERIKSLERENRDLRTHMPNETQIVLLKEEIERLKQSTHALKEENCKIKHDYSHLKILHEQTEHVLAEYQNKLILAERQLDATNSQINNLDSNREATQNEAAQLQNEVCALKRTYIAVEQEKDKLLVQLDAKTERVYQLEFELKTCKMKRDSLEKHLIELESQLQKCNKKTSELHDTATESNNLRQQIATLKCSREKAIAENSRLTNELAESQAEVAALKKRLKSSESEIEKLKQQLRQYVQEVKKAEDLLLQKEQERDEMLEHYRSLSHDAVLLEGNNQSLEVEAAEYKRQIRELETEIDRLKKDIHCQTDAIEKLEDKVAVFTSQNTCLERQLEEAIDDQRLLKTDLAARKELCDKLDIEKEKLNAELSELNQIRKKLEKDIETIRGETNKTSATTVTTNRTPVDALEELLVKTRHDLEEQIKVDSKLSLELVRLRQQNDELLKDLEVEREKCKQQEALAHEYRIQSQELRHNLTDDRFRQALSREQSPQFPTQTI